MKEQIFLSPPHMGGHEMDYIKEAFESNWVAPLGSNVDLFEEMLCKYTKTDFSLAVCSGTAALHLILLALGIKEGDRVFCSDLTFVGSVNPILYVGAEPVFIDSDPDSWNMSPQALQKAFEEAKAENILPKAVIIVDLYGFAARYDELLPICEKYGVPVVEDAAEALGTTYNGVGCAAFGDYSILSFNGNKIITTSGGGMALGNNEQAFKKMRFWATQARENERHYEHKEKGFNYRLSNVCAGIGCGQMIVLDERIKQKKHIHNAYVELLKNIPAEIAEPIEGCEANYWLNLLMLSPDSELTPNQLLVAFDRENIEGRPIWLPMHRQPLFSGTKFYSHSPQGASVGLEKFRNGICLPSGTALTDSQIERICDVILKTIRRKEI